MAAGREEAYEKLAHSWRRVASTHELQDLLKPEPDNVPRARPLLRRVAGLAMLLAAVGLALLYTAHTVVLLVPPERLPPFLDAVRRRSELIFRLTFTFHVTALAALMHWFSRKMFKHNSA